MQFRSYLVTVPWAELRSRRGVPAAPDFSAAKVAVFAVSVLCPRVALLYGGGTPAEE